MSVQIHNVEWNKYIRYCYKLALCLKKHIGGKTAIVTMPRGGYIPSSIIAYQLNISRIFSCGYQSYVGKEKGLGETYQGLPRDISDLETIFLIDDIIDTNKTVSDVKYLIDSKNINGFNLYVASVFVKSKSKEYADFYIEEIPDNVWVKFPYDR